MTKSHTTILVFEKSSWSICVVMRIDLILVLISGEIYWSWKSFFFPKFYNCSLHAYKYDVQEIN